MKKFLLGLVIVAAFAGGLLLGRLAYYQRRPGYRANPRERIPSEFVPSVVSGFLVSAR